MDDDILGSSMGDDIGEFPDNYDDANGGDGLDGFLPQDDEGKFPVGVGEEDGDIFAGTDMADTNIDMAENEPLELLPGDLEMKDDSLGTSAIAQWEADHSAALADKREKARKAKEELLEQARTNIEKFYSERKQKQESIKAQNKENEQGYFSEMKDLMQHGAPWEKVGRLVNLAPKANEKPGTSKVNRMRQLLIQLKNEKKNN